MKCHICCCCCLVASVKYEDLCATLWTAACQAPLSMGFSREDYWSGLPRTHPGDLPDSEIKPRSPALQADSLPLSDQGSPYLKSYKRMGQMLSLCTHQFKLLRKSQNTCQCIARNLFLTQDLAPLSASSKPVSHFRVCLTILHSLLHHFKKLMGKQWKYCQTLFFGAPKSLQMVTAAIKLKEAYSLEGKL